MSLWQELRYQLILINQYFRSQNMKITEEILNAV